MSRNHELLDGLNRREADELRAVTAALSTMGEPYEAPPRDLNASVMAAVSVAAASEPMTRPAAAPRRRRLPWRGLSLGFAGAFAAAAAAVVIAVGITNGPSGEIEIDGTMAGAATASLEVEALGSGREIRIQSDQLEILPTGEFYEVWFVGPGDSPSAPNRISGGTFHPDENGVTEVVLHAAVDPAKYPRVEITAEPGGGDPGVDGPVVATLDS